MELTDALTPLMLPAEPTEPNGGHAGHDAADDGFCATNPTAKPHLDDGGCSCC
jgi:hypothetical protein